MRYIRSSGSFKQHKPQRNGWFGFLSLNKRKTSISSAISLPPLRANPYKKIRGQRRGILSVVKKVAFPAVFLAWLMLMVYIPYFKIHQVTYIGLSTIKREDIQNKLNDTFLTTKWGIPRNNYFLLRSKSITNFLQDEYSFETIEVEKKFPHTLIIDVVEKATSIIIDTGNGYYMVDQSGAAIRQILTENTSVSGTFAALILDNASTTTSTPLTATIEHTPDYTAVQKDYKNIPLVYIPQLNNNTSTITISPNLVRVILEAHSQATKGKIARIKYVEVNPDEQTLTMYSDKPWKVIMRTVGDIGSQIDNLKVIIRDNKPTEYVDVRFGDRVYWK